MLTRIVRPSPALDTFLQPLTAHLSQPQRQHLLELADALLVCEGRNRSPAQAAMQNWGPSTRERCGYSRWVSRWMR